MILLILPMFYWQQKEWHERTFTEFYSRKGSFLAFFLLYVCSKKQLKESIIVENKYDFCCSVSLIVQHEGSQTREPTYSFCTRVSSAKLRLKSKHNSLKVHCTSLFVELFSFNFIYSEKATKFAKSSPYFWLYVPPWYVL